MCLSVETSGTACLYRVLESCCCIKVVSHITEVEKEVSWKVIYKFFIYNEAIKKKWLFFLLEDDLIMADQSSLVRSYAQGQIS